MPVLAALLAAFAILTAHPATASRNLLAPVPNQKPGVRKYIMDVRVGTAAPDCVSRPVILVNGQFQPTITVKQGETLVASIHYTPLTSILYPL
jgi:FtsP/CotA-like multicopper oxidase with cupredoxin domain